MGSVREVFSVDTGIKVLGGTAGLSASLWGPKLLGHMVYAPLGRGYGGVASSIVSTSVASWLIGKVSPRAGQAAFVGGMIGAFAGLLSAIHCGLRSQVLPLESGLLACALPTAPTTPASAPSTLADANAAQIQSLVNSGMPAPAAAAMVDAQNQAAGLKDYIWSGQRGMSGYGGSNPAGMQNLLAMEQAFRNANGGSNVGSLNDYVSQVNAGTRGMRDYAVFQTSASSSSMDDSPESF
jgi:hypothetical protein